MSSDDIPNELPGEDYSDFVPAVFAPSVEEAERYRDLLSDHDILALVGDEDGDEKTRGAGNHSAMTHGVPVLVPEVFLDEASEVIADHEDIDEFQVADDEVDDDEDEELGLEGTLNAELDKPFGEDDEDDEDGLLNEDDEDYPDEEPY